MNSHILDQQNAGLMVMQRANGVAEWTTITLVAGDILAIPGLGIEIPVDELYEDVKLPADSDSSPELA